MNSNSNTTNTILQLLYRSTFSAFSAMTLLVGHQEKRPASKNRVIRCWCGYLSGARCRHIVCLHKPAPSVFVGAEFYCPHALADGNQRIRIREKMQEFSSTVLSTLSPYLDLLMNNCVRYASYMRTTVLGCISCMH